MRRVISLLMMICLLGAAASCGKETAGGVPVGDVLVELKAQITDSKANVTSAGVVTWESGDQIDVYTTEGNVRVFTLSKIDEGIATFTAQLPASETPASVAVFPSGCLKSVSGSTATINYPSSYTYASGAMKAPMFALVDGSATLEFKHLGAMMRVACNPVPDAATSFHLVCKDMQNVGNFNATVGESMQVTSSSAATNTKCRVNFDAAVGDSKTFLVPVPAGEYSSVYAYFTDASGDKIREWQVLTDVTVEKAQMYNRPMPSMMRVLSYNWLLDYGSTDAKQPWTTVRKSNMIAALPSYHFDVMGSQESTTQQISDVQAEVSGYAVSGKSNAGHPLTSLGSTSDYSVNAIWRKSGITLLESGTFWYSDTPDSPSSKKNYFKKEDGKYVTPGVHTCNWAKLSSGGKTFYLFDTHFQVNGNGETVDYDPVFTQIRLYQWSILRPRIAAVAGDYPVILTGDFNNTVNDEGDIIQTILADKDLNLKDAYTSTPQPHGSVGTLNYFKAVDSNRRIDFVFVNDKFDVESYRVDSSQQTTEAWTSDHNPLIVDLSFVN